MKHGIYGILLVALVGCANWSTGPKPPAELAEVVTHLRALPDWAVRHDDDGLLLPMRSKIFVLMRVMFAVPDTLPRDEVEVFSGYAAWVQQRQTDAPYPIGWPVSVSADGEMRIQAYAMYQGGGPHRSLDEFDWFDAAFPPRAVD